MIFRKENRGDSFQRQVSNLRSPAETEEETEASERNYDESRDTSRYSPDEPAAPESPYAPSRTPDAATTQYRTQPTPTQSSRQQPPPAPAQSQELPTLDSSTSVISSSSHWDGTLKSKGSLHVHGRADGELHAATDMYVAEGAEVDAQIFAENVVVAGLVRGKIEARSRLEVLQQGQVTGDVMAPKLIVHEGATITGQLKMESSISSGS